MLLVQVRHISDRFPEKLTLSTDKCLKNATEWVTTAMVPASITYDYEAHPPACLKSGLPAVAGAGKGLATLICE